MRVLSWQTAYRTASARVGAAVSLQLRRKPHREQDRALYRVADRALVSRETGGSVVTVPRSVIGDALAGDETVAIAGFETCSARDRTARRGRIPRSAETVAIAATRTPAFRVGKTSRHGRNRVTA